jgi:hypothetical protein
MKIIITESKLNKVALKWMNLNFSPDQLEVIEHPDYPNSIFYRKNGKVVMEQNKKNERFWFSYEDIWSFFESFFGMEHQEIQEVLRYWLEDTFKLGGYTPFFSSKTTLSRLEDTFKLGGYTPAIQNSHRW